MPRVVVLRLGHRIPRDSRITTHVGLVARAFGADGIILADTTDLSVERSLRKVVERWGGPFFVRAGEPWQKVIQDWRSAGGTVVHLTMYGLPIERVIPNLRNKDLLIVVGAEKVPGEVFELADFNIAVGNQPHSEVAALAILLDRLFKGAELEKKFLKGKLKIIPTKKGKKLEKR